MSVCTDEDILWLEVAVDDARCVQAFDALDDLGGVEARTVATQTAPAGELRREVTTRVKVLEILSASHKRRTSDRENAP